MPSSSMAARKRVGERDCGRKEESRQERGRETSVMRRKVTQENHKEKKEERGDGTTATMLEELSSSSRIDSVPSKSLD